MRIETACFCLDVREVGVKSYPDLIGVLSGIGIYVKKVQPKAVSLWLVAFIILDPIECENPISLRAKLFDPDGKLLDYTDPMVVKGEVHPDTGLGYGLFQQPLDFFFNDDGEHAGEIWIDETCVQRVPLNVIRVD